MVVNLREVLAADPKGQSIDKLEISCGGQNYEARVSFLRNLAVAYRVSGGEGRRAYPGV